MISISCQVSAIAIDTTILSIPTTISRTFICAVCILMVELESRADHCNSAGDQKLHKIYIIIHVLYLGFEKKSDLKRNNENSEQIYFLEIDKQ